MGEWLRAQTPETVRALHSVNAEFVDGASQQAQPARWSHAGEVELFFDDTEVGVEGNQFEGARVNYEGQRALGWQTFWLGPWLLDGFLGGAADENEHLGVLSDEHLHRWQGRLHYFCAEYGSSAGESLNRIKQGGFDHWSVNYDKWSNELDRLAAQYPCRASIPRKQVTVAPFGLRFGDGVVLRSSCTGLQLPVGSGARPPWMIATFSADARCSS